MLEITIKILEETPEKAAESLQRLQLGLSPDKFDFSRKPVLKKMWKSSDFVVDAKPIPASEEPAATEAKEPEAKEPEAKEPEAPTASGRPRRRASAPTPKTEDEPTPEPKKRKRRTKLEMAHDNLHAQIAQLDKGQGEEVKALLSEFGVTKVTSLQKDDIDEFTELLKEIASPTA